MFRISSLLLIAGIGIGSVAQAVPVTFLFEGTITEVNPNNTVPFNGVNEFPGVNPGDAFSGHYTFESEGDPELSGFGDTATYFYTANSFEMRVEFGSFVLVTDPSLEIINTSVPAGSHSAIVVSDNAITPFDAYRVRSTTTLPSGNNSGAFGPDLLPTSAISMDIDLFTTSNLAAVTSLDLPTSPPDLSAFTQARFALLGGFPNVFVVGDITSMSLLDTVQVPEPSTWLLLLLGLGLLAAARAFAVRELRTVRPIVGRRHSRASARVSKNLT